MKFQMNKTKLIARVMVLVILLTSAFSFVGCALTENPVVLDREIPNLDDYTLGYLMIGDLSNCEYITNVDYLDYAIDGEFTVKNGEMKYEPAIIKFSAGFDVKGISKKSYNNLLVKNSALSIMGHFYPIKGDIGELEYDFKRVDSTPYKYRRVVYIYSNSQLVGKVYYDAQKRVKKSWIEDFLNDNLISMTINKYSNIDNAVDKADLISSYLSIGNVATSSYCSNLINYSANINGGLQFEYGSKYYTDVVNSVNIEFEGDESINNAHILIDADFYESKFAVDCLKYEVVETSINNKNMTINVYSDTVLVGTVNIDSKEEISIEWIEGFFNENLIIVEIQ